MRSWVARIVAVAAVAGTVLVIDGGVADAAPAYQLVAVDGQGAAVPGDTTSASASADGHAVAFAVVPQTGADCPSSTVFVRDRAARTTATVGTGTLPAISADGTKVAFVSCSGPEISLWNGSAATPLTSGQWRQGGANTIRQVAMAPKAGVVAFAVGPAVGAATALWLAHADGSAPVKVAASPGDIGDVAVTDGLVALVAGGQPYVTSATQPGSPTRLPTPGGSVVGISLSEDGQTVAVANGDGVYVSVKRADPVLVTNGALEPSVAPDGATVAVTMASGAIRTFTTAAPALVSAAGPVAAGGFSAPIASTGGREVVFLAKPGSAAGGTSANVQVFALGPGLVGAATNFGDVGVGTTTAKTVTFTNEGTVTVTPTAVVSSNAAEFAIAANGTTCLAGQAIAVGQSCVVQVALTPAAAGARSATLTIAQQDASWDAVAAAAALTANAVNGQLSATPTAIDFGSVTLGSTSAARSFTVTNAGTLPTTIGTLLVSGAEAAEFSLAGGTCAAAALAPGATCTVSLTFAPGGTGERTASMDVGGSGGAAVSVALSGTGADPPRPALAVSPTALDFDEQVVGAAGASQAVTVRNSGNVANTASVQLSGAAAADFTIASNGCAGRSLAAGSSCTLSVSFAPQVPGARVSTLAIAGSGGSSASVRLTGTARLNPVLAAVPAVVVPGQVVVVTGTSFAAGAAVTVTWDGGGPTASAVADGDGSFTTALVVPAGFGGGTRRVVVAAPADATTATAPVLVQQPSLGGPVSPGFRNSPAFRN